MHKMLGFWQGDEEESALNGKIFGKNEDEGGPLYISLKPGQTPCEN